MKLFDARQNAIPIFGLRTKHFLTTSNIDISDILEISLHVVLPPWRIKELTIVLDLVHTKKDRTHGNSREEPVYTDGSGDRKCVDCATVFSSNTIISMRLPDSASLITAEI